MKKWFEIKWASRGTVLVDAESQKEAADMFSECPLDWVDKSDLCDNCQIDEEK